MIRNQILIIALFLIPVYWCIDVILISSIEVRNDVGSIDCTNSKLMINNQNFTPICEVGYDNTKSISYITLAYNASNSVQEGNTTYHLDTKVTVPNGNKTKTDDYQYTGVFVVDKTVQPNTVAVGYLTLEKFIPATTAAPPTTKPKKREAGFPQEQLDAEPTAPVSNKTSLTINYIRLKYEETSKQSNSNGGAVAVAIIEGIALIAILAYMGYRTMVKHRMKESSVNAAMYGFDNNSRITVSDSIRMNDIPPPRDPTYATPPPAPFSQQPPARNTVMTTQELVVPQTSASVTRPTTTSNTTSNTTNGQFNDPFDSLDSW
ncbi:hypothetical protein L5515_003813 [Caenorhabditis briggsae]|uniref:Uncharacterized protein n=1 Tax=Caenorhabditis briggsae TaxID=6238 RepID=A0AAE9DAQ0_CAEBR|nr:hypothetical protein L3Y34_000956 [Caenorhabditis briggsae]UMM22761.1 hypothetical protein L5515_003813 [Caenorhabditis briggsae]